MNEEVIKYHFKAAFNIKERRPSQKVQSLFAAADQLSSLPVLCPKESGIRNIPLLPTALANRLSHLTSAFRVTTTMIDIAPLCL
jgi:hypothetical protein